MLTLACIIDYFISALWLILALIFIWVNQEALKLLKINHIFLTNKIFSGVKQKITELVKVKNFM